MNKELFLRDVGSIIKSGPLENAAQLLYDYVKGIALDPRHNNFCKKVDTEVIIDHCCERFKVSLLDMIAQNREDEICTKRQMTMYMLKRYSPIGSRTIARLFQRERTTVIHAEKRISDLLATDIMVRNHIVHLEQSLELGTA